VEAKVTGAGSLFNVHFTREEVRDAVAASSADKNKLVEYDLRLIGNGVFFLPGHNGALCSAHASEDLNRLYRETEQCVKHFKC
jgi:glutamate-1-semialdehyde aminotransferase